MPLGTLTNLFAEVDLQHSIAQIGQQLIHDLDALTEEMVLGTSQEDLAKHFVAKYHIEPPVFLEEGVSMNYQDTPVDVSRDPLRFVDDRSQPFYIDGTRITFHLPFTGDASWLLCRPARVNLRTVKTALIHSEVVFIYEKPGEIMPDIRSAFDEDFAHIKNNLVLVSEELEQFNAALPNAVIERLRARRTKMLRERDVATSIGFPLRRTQPPPATFVTPEVRRRSIPAMPRPSTEPFRPEPTLDMDEYEHILSLLSNMVGVMERSPGAFTNIGEESLRSHFLMQLNGLYELQATGETFNYEGKTDIFVRTAGKNVFVAECKFWSGPAGLSATLDQLLRYASWRDNKTAILIFNRGRNTSTILNSVPVTVRNHAYYKADRETDSETTFRYIFGHPDDPNREIIITILVFDVPA